jgi:ABC-2 type transport system ATP-binding protein
LILDEPTNGLDPRGRREIHDVLLELARRGVGIMLCTHLLDDVDRLCTKIGIIHHGKTLLEGDLAQLLAARTASRYRLRLESAPEKISATLPPGVKIAGREGHWIHLDVPADRSPAEVWKQLLDSGWNILEIHHEGGGLEDLYLAVTEESKAA